VEERYCRQCGKIKSSLEFEQPTKIRLPTYRLPWLRMILSSHKEFNQIWLDGGMPGSKSYEKQKKNGETEDEETIASYKSDLVTTNDMLRIINALGLPDKNIARGLEPYWVEIPANDYQRKWFRWLFLWERRWTRDIWRKAKERKHEHAIVDINGDLEMIGYFLKIVDISLKDVCRDCCMMLGI
jgi:hypothetical protein